MTDAHSSVLFVVSFHLPSFSYHKSFSTSSKHLTVSLLTILLPYGLFSKLNVIILHTLHARVCIGEKKINQCHEQRGFIHLINYGFLNDADSSSEHTVSDDRMISE